MIELKNSLNNLMTIMKSTNSKKKIIIVKDFLIYVLILCFLKTPFILIRDVVVDYFSNMNVGNILARLFYWSFEILYILFTILMIRNWLIKKFSTNNND